ncbi:MAG: hypothetical protein P9X24_12810 [Candidatus Hatepunaea meridiana]|nr:hypothetical protein [Candidatus Hatepunaea meridiana]
MKAVILVFAAIFVVLIVAIALYIFIPGTIDVASEKKAEILIDGKKVGAINENEISSFRVSAGKHNISIVELKRPDSRLDTTVSVFPAGKKQIHYPPKVEIVDVVKKKIKPKPKPKPQKPIRPDKQVIKEPVDREKIQQEKIPPVEVKEPEIEVAVTPPVFKSVIKGSIIIKSKLPGGRVLLDNVVMGTTNDIEFIIDNLPIDTKYNVVIQSPEGYYDFDKTVLLTENQPNVTLTYKPGKEKQLGSTLVVASNINNGVIKIDDEVIPKKTIAGDIVKISVKSGNRMIEISHPSIREDYWARTEYPCEAGVEVPFDWPVPMEMDVFNPALIKLTSVVAGVKMSVFGEVIEGPEVHANTPVIFEYEMKEMMLEDALVKIFNPKYIPQTMRINLKAGFESEVRFENPEVQNYFVEVKMPALDMSDYQSLNFFFDTIPEPCYTYTSGETDITLSDLPRSLKRVRIVFKSEDYEYRGLYDVKFTDKQSCLLKPDQFHPVRIESDPVGATVYEKKSAEYNKIGTTPVEFPVLTKYFKIGLKMPGQDMEVRQINSRKRKHIVVFLSPEAAKKMSEAERLFNSSLDPSLTPVDAIQKLKQADALYHEVLTLSPEYTQAKLKRSIAIINILEFDHKSGVASNIQLIKARCNKVQVFTDQVIEETNEPIDKALAIYMQGKAKTILGDNSSGNQKINLYKKSVDLMKESLDYYQKGSLPNKYRLLYDGSYANKAATERKLFDATSDDHWRNEAIKTWNSYDFPDLPSRTYRPIPNKYKEIKYKELKELKR